MSPDDPLEPPCRRRLLGVACVLVAVTLAACGTAMPTPPATAAPPSPVRSVAPSPVRSAAVSPSVDSWAFGATRRTGTITTVALPPGMQAHRLAAEGPLVVFDEIGYGADIPGRGTHIFLADLEHQTMTTLRETGNGDAAWMPAISGGTAAWSEWSPEHRDGSGAVKWRVVVAPLDGSSPTTIATGINRRFEGDGAVPPLVAIDGDHVAYTVEDPSPDRRWGWQVVVVSRSSGKVLDRYPTSLSIYWLALQDETVLYTEGEVDEQISFKYATRLVLATPDNPAGTEIAKDAFEVAMANDRLAWVTDPESSQLQIGMAQHPKLMTAALSDPSAAKLVTDVPGWKGAYWPSTADGIVAWSENVGDPAVNRVALWDATNGTVIVDRARGPVAMMGGNGWLTWYDDSAEGINVVLHGTRLAELARP